MKNLALLISGGGTTAAAIITACRNGGTLHGLINPVCVIASNIGAGGIQRARDAGISEDAIHVIDPRAGDNRNNPARFGDHIIGICEKHDAQIIGQYGWLPHTPENVIQRFPWMINQHPAPLDPGRPDFGGDRMFGRIAIFARFIFCRLACTDYWTEATAHRVAPKIDRGALLQTERVPINSNDDLETLKERLLEAEHRVQIATLRLFGNGGIGVFERAEPLIRKEHLPHLEMAKAFAKLAYPKG